MRLHRIPLIIGLVVASASPVFAQKADQAQFKAYIDQMPGTSPGHKIIVLGSVICNTTGWKVELTEASPPGINPSILILDVKSTKPSGMAGQMITPVLVRFDKNNGEKYKQVTIRGAGADFTIDVGSVQ